MIEVALPEISHQLHATHEQIISFIKFPHGRISMQRKGEVSIPNDAQVTHLLTADKLTVQSACVLNS